MKDQGVKGRAWEMTDRVVVRVEEGIRMERRWQEWDGMQEGESLGEGTRWDGFGFSHWEKSLEGPRVNLVLSR